MNYPLLDNTGSNMPLTPLIIIIVGGVLLIAVAVAFLVVFLKRRTAKKMSGGLWLEALGGHDNIEDVSGVGSRVTLLLKDKEAINREQLKTLGVSSVLTMSNKVILVIEDQAVNIAEKIRQEL